MFWCIRGLEPREIATRLNDNSLEHETTENIINGVAHKFKPWNYELSIKKAEALDYRMCIPEHGMLEQTLSKAELA